MPCTGVTLGGVVALPFEVPVAQAASAPPNPATSRVENALREIGLFGADSTSSASLSIWLSLVPVPQVCTDGPTGGRWVGGTLVSRTTEAHMYDHQWNRVRANNPEHSSRYVQRWRNLAAQGADIYGEARFASALAAPGAAILDAGCGTGRVAGFLQQQGYKAVGVDLDEVLVAEARSVYPQGEWAVGDLATFDYASFESVHVDPDGSSGFDVIISAGNVMAFLDPASRVPTLENMRSALGPGGRVVAGFGAGRGYAFSQYEDDLITAGLEVQATFSTWDMRPFDARSDFLVCVAGVVTPLA